MPGPQRQWPYRRCHGCDHVFLHPAPDEAELARHYNTNYAVPRAWYERQVEREFAKLRRIVTDAGVRRGSMLEIGCSYGSMLRRFRDVGWETAGIEWDARAARVAREEHGLSVLAGSVEDGAPTLKGRFDVVVGSHVIEHALDPRRLLASLAPVMRSGSLLILRTPNSRSLAARVCQGWWQWAVAPEHVHLFSPDSLERLLADEGFSSIQRDFRRGDANSTLFELVHSAGKVAIGNTDEGRAEKLSGAGPRPLSSGALFQSVRTVLNGVGAPLDYAFGRSPTPLRSLLPEFLVVARKNP